LETVLSKYAFHLLLSLNDSFENLARYHYYECG